MQTAQKSPFYFPSDGLAVWGPDFGKIMETFKMFWMLRLHHPASPNFNQLRMDTGNQLGSKDSFTAAEKSLKWGKCQQALLQARFPLSGSRMQGPTPLPCTVGSRVPEPGLPVPPRLQEEPRPREQRLGSPWDNPCYLLTGEKCNSGAPRPGPQRNLETGAGLSLDTPQSKMNQSD